MDEKLQKNTFVREKIKEKPINKKRAALRLLFSALCGFVFAAVVCIVLIFALPHILKPYIGAEVAIQDTEEADGTETLQNTQQNEPETETIVPPEPTTETEMVSTEAELPTTDTPDTQAPEDVIPILPEISLTIEDYQKLQDQLYEIGSRGNNSIVTITGLVSDTDIFNNPYESADLGCGLLVGENSEEYLILTERKLISDASTIRVTFADDESVEATLKKADGNTGLAIVAVPKRKMKEETIGRISIASFGNSKFVKNGAIVIALGSPLGTNYSILTGNVTSISNEITTEDHNYSVFTTDIIANSNGSGFLCNTEGEIIGIVMQGYGTASGNTITALAISDLLPIIEMLEEGKDIPYLGLHVSTVTKGISKTYDMPAGVYIRAVSMDSPAMKAGLQSGDVIVSIDGKKMNSVWAYSAEILGLSTEKSVPVVIKRKGANGYTEISFDVTAGVLP